MNFAPVEELIHEIAEGRMVILVDGADRENEGDLVMAAAPAEAEAIRFMATHGRGLICAPVAPHVADRLGLGPMTEDPTDPDECAFTISVDALEGTTTGISAFDRARTARRLAQPDASPHDFKRPGHLFPLRAKAGGVLERPGHTEAAVELAALAGFAPVGVICEVMNDDGTMSRVPDLRQLAQRAGLCLGRISDLIEFKRRRGLCPVSAQAPAGVRLLSAAALPTPFGVFEIHVFESVAEGEIAVLTLGDVSRAARSGRAVLTRLHSACFTGDVLGSLRCDCGGQLQLALRRVGEEGLGMVAYLPQEGRGIGLAKKVEAYRLQEKGLDTVEANLKLGFPADLRSYRAAAAVLGWFGIERVRLLTNNPAKIRALEEASIEVSERVPLEAGPGPVNHAYLRTKKGKLGHLFEAV